MVRMARPSTLARVVGWIVGPALILLGSFVLSAASFADGSATERAITIAAAVGVIVLGVVILRLVRVRAVAQD
jgi:hypothetical protein